jgi:uncharacterized protein (TIGR02391 family)
MPKSFPPFSATTITAIAKVLDELSGAEITRVLREARMHDPLGPGATKWKRLEAAMNAAQSGKSTGGAIAHFIKVTMSPERFVNDRDAHESMRAALNRIFVLSGFEFTEERRWRAVRTATTLFEAQARASRLRGRLEDRGVHPDVLRFCSAELVAENYFHAVLEAAKSVFEKIRERTGIDDDGAELAQTAFSLAKNMPPLAFNRLQGRSERSEHTGYSNLVQGLAGAVRNPHAHAPKVLWPQIEEQDALDLLSFISLLHRRLDKALVTPGAPAMQTA